MVAAAVKTDGRWREARLGPFFSLFTTAECRHLYSCLFAASDRAVSIKHARFIAS